VSSPSLLGAIRERILGDAALSTALPGKIHTNELPQKPLYPAVVLRWPRTEYQYQTVSGVGNQGQPVTSTIKKPQVEVWIDCISAEQGEQIGLLIEDRLTDRPLPWTIGTQIQVFPVNFWLADEVGRSPSGDKQYSWCLQIEAWFIREADRPAS